MLSRDWGKLQMPKTGKEAIFDLPWHHHRLKNTTPGEGGKILILRCQV
jgi:hypothetical protein